MAKTTLKAIFILLFLFPSASAGGCLEFLDIYTDSGEYVGEMPLPTCYEPDLFWWLKKDDPTLQPWKEKLRSTLKEIAFQDELSDIIKDLEVLATMYALAEHLSPDSRKLFYSEIDSLSKKIAPEELDIQFSH